jgi:ABC-2 type transport system ATP-binding protein
VPGTRGDAARLKKGGKSMTAIVVAEQLSKRYKQVEALRGLDLAVMPGTVCGVLGPNGAGKTTALRILATLVRPDGGRATVCGYDVARQPEQVRASIGLAGQYAAVDEQLSGRDNLRIFGRLYHLSGRESARRADDLLERLGLASVGPRPVSTYSGGMRRRLDLLASLLVAPRVLFLDEPTTGLDPASRNEIWSAIRQLVRDGTTVLLTTQYLDEADQLADDIAVVDQGRVVASGPPEELKATIGNRLDVVVHDAATLDAAAAGIRKATGTEPELVPERRCVSAPVRAGALVLADVIRELDRGGVAVEDIGLRRPTLDEVFLRLTGSRR